LFKNRKENGNESNLKNIIPEIVLKFTGKEFLKFYYLCSTNLRLFFLWKKY